MNWVNAQVHVIRNDGANDLVSVNIDIDQPWAIGIRDALERDEKRTGYIYTYRLGVVWVERNDFVELSSDDYYGELGAFDQGTMEREQ